MSTAAAAKVSADVDVAHDLCSGGSHAIRLSPQQEQVANLVNATEGEQFRPGNMQFDSPHSRSRLQISSTQPRVSSSDREICNSTLPTAGAGCKSRQRNRG